jgi:hypothetical protein
MYGIYLNIHPSPKSKYVMIHKATCATYKQFGGGQQIYSFNKNAKSLREAIETASEYSLEWHAPMRICKICFKRGSKSECIF